MKCEKCGVKEAELHFYEIVDGKEIYHHFCKKCADENDFYIKPKKLDISSQSLVGGLLNIISGKTDREITCQKCGMTFEEFKKIGRFGCSQCYYDFDEQVDPILRKIHGTTLHRGKHPKNYDLYNRDEEIAVLKEELESAVKKEEFEKAALIRDKLRTLSEVSS